MSSWQWSNPRQWVHGYAGRMKTIGKKEEHGGTSFLNVWKTRLEPHKDVTYRQARGKMDFWALIWFTASVAASNTIICTLTLNHYSGKTCNIDFGSRYLCLLSGCGLERPSFFILGLQFCFNISYISGAKWEPAMLLRNHWEMNILPFPCVLSKVY